MRELDQINNLERQQWISGIKFLPTILLKTWTPITERASYKKNNKIEVDAPAMVQSYVNDINIWKLKLPEIDRNRDEYIVVPSNWLIVPVNYVPKTSEDYEKLINWKEVNANLYLKTWVMSLPGTSVNDYWQVWNRIIYGHSSYWKDDDGRYKTQFQKIIELDVGEEIWVYKIQSNWTFKRFVYKVEKSYETKPTDVWILTPGLWSNLTLITCTPIWWTEWRWVVRAKFVNENKWELEKYLYGNNVSIKYRIAISKFLGEIESLEKTERERITLKVFSRIQNSENNNQNNSKMLNLLNYLKLKLAISYKKIF
jgi:hypothetical protein